VPVAGRTDQYICDWSISAANVLDGAIQVNFDVRHLKGGFNLAPNGIHEGTVQR